MRTVHISTSKNYDVIIGENLIDKTGEFVSEVCKKAEKIAVITDDTVDGLYSSGVVTSLKSKGFEICKFVFKNGENSKSISTLSEILNFLAENNITRTDAVIALGGGVVGDVAGFAAATFLRGIDFVQIPTTLLAMVDSSVGGKTAINLDSGKNLAGAFYQPNLVICDYTTLKTLPLNIFSDGCSEVIKYGIISDKDFFKFLESHNINDNLEFVIERCVSIKAKTVMSDEHDYGVRQLLNFGHTIGHAIEKCSLYKISHGSAVAIGMVAVSKGAFLCNMCKSDLSERIKNVLLKYNLPTECAYSAKQLFPFTLSDKKRSGSETTLVIPDSIGNCVLKKLSSENIYEIIEKGIS